MSNGHTLEDQCPTPSKLQLSLWPFAFSDNSHDASADPARSLLERLVSRALLVVEIVIAVILKNGLRHDRISLAERRGSVQDLASGI